MRLFALTIIFSCFLLSVAAQKETKLTIDPYTFTFDNEQKIEGELGSYFVPESRKRKSARNISLSFLRFKAFSANTSNPIVFLADQIEKSSIKTFSRIDPDLLEELRKIGDVIVFDRRGTGQSTPLPLCTTRADLTSKRPLSKGDYFTEIRSVVRDNLSCWEEKGIDISGYQYTEFVNDLESLRTILAADQLSFIANGFGGREALGYASSSPEKVDRVALINAEGPGQKLKMPRDVNKYIHRLNIHLKRDTLAERVYPELNDLMRSVFYQLVQKPVKVRIKTPLDNRSEVIGISKFDVQLATSKLLIDDLVSAQRLPYLFQQMEDGNFDEMGLYVYSTRKYYQNIHPMKFLAGISDDDSEKHLQLIQEQMEGAILGYAPNFPFPDLDLSYEMEILKKEINKNEEIKAPVLIFSGTLDGRTSLERGRALDAQLPNAEHVVVDGAGRHLLESTALVKQMLVDFLSGKEVTGQVILLPRISFDVK